MTSLQDRIQKKKEELRLKEEETFIENEARKQIIAEERKKKEEMMLQQVTEIRNKSIEMIMIELEKALETNSHQIINSLQNKACRPGYNCKGIHCANWSHDKNLNEYIDECSATISRRIKEEEERKENEKWENTKKAFSEMSDEDLLNYYNNVCTRAACRIPTYYGMPTEQKKRHDEELRRSSILHSVVETRFGCLSLEKCRHTLQKIKTEREMEEKRIAEKNAKIKDFKEFLSKLSSSERLEIISNISNETH